MSDNNQKAFPCFTQDPWGKPKVFGGMTLRDYFAAKAMQGVMINSKDTLLLDSENEVNAVAKLSYMIADAMLKEREK